jgi:hypothetical protein
VGYEWRLRRRAGPISTWSGFWKSPARLIKYFFGRDQPGLSRIYFLAAADQLFLPVGVHVFLDAIVQAPDQTQRNIGALLARERQKFMFEFFFQGGS